MLIEDYKDAGYVLPAEHGSVGYTGPAVNYLVIHDRARELGLMAERLAARRVEWADD
jgi:hypothetical protein